MAGVVPVPGDDVITEEPISEEVTFALEDGMKIAAKVRAEPGTWWKGGGLGTQGGWVVGYEVKGLIQQAAEDCRSDTCLHSCLMGCITLESASARQRSVMVAQGRLDRASGSLTVDGGV
jgi:hypothetical protein